jgi:hypothetical protein
MLAKLSSSSTMSAASLATSVPSIPIAIPMCALFSAGCIIDSVTGNRDDVPLLLQGFDDASFFLISTNACEDNLGRVQHRPPVEYRKERRAYCRFGV